MIKDVKLNGVKKLTKKDQSIVENLINKKLDKIERQVKQDFSLTALVKEYEKEGERKKYSVDLTLKIAKNYFKSKEAGWDLAKAVNKAIKKIQTEIEHKFHTSDQH